MSWLYSQALVEEFLEENSLVGEQLQQLNGNLTQQAYLSKDKMKDFSRLSRSGMTFKLLTENLGKELLTWYLEDSLAKTSLVLEEVQGLEESEVQCGIICSESSLKSNQNMPSSKIPLTFVLKDLLPSCKDLPKSGIMQSGVCYPLKTVVPIIKENACGYLLPTPTCHNAREGGYPAEGKRNTPTLGWVLGGKPNPLYTEWMMGWPIGWTDLKPLETDKFQLWQQQLSFN